MARRMKMDIDISPEADAALARVTELAHRLAAGLAGEALPENGLVKTPRAAQLAMGMVYFLVQVDPEDFAALFLAEGSAGQFTRRPPRKIPELFADLL